MPKSPPIRQINRHAIPSSSRPQPSQLTLDLLLHALSKSIFHPFIACLLPLCLRALAASYDSTSFILTSLFAATVCLYHILAFANHRIAYGSPRPIDWQHEVVVITGGSSGLGSCIAEIYSLRGISVAVLDISVSVSTSGEEREGIHYYHCDVSSPESIAAVWAQIANTLGTPTVLINNAAISTSTPLQRMSAETLRKVFEVNTLSHFHTTRVLLSSLSSRQKKRRGATIVTISSVLGRLGAANLSAYTASKAALIAYHASLSAELAATAPQVKTILVAPGQLDTQLFADMKMQGWLQRFVGPVVGAGELAMRIVEMVDKGLGGEIRMPAYAACVAWVGVLPMAVQRGVRWWSGIDEAVGVVKGLMEEEETDEGNEEHEGTSTEEEGEDES